jgi:hypothetical protein
MGIGGRLDRLERSLGVAGCPECGLGGAGPVVCTVGEPLRYGERFVAQRCGTCGRQISFTLTLDNPQGVGDGLE